MHSSPAPDPAPGLYIVATPIGNLRDLTTRARDLLAAADLVACEDTRVTGKLLAHLGLKRPLRAYHDHSSDAARASIIVAARSGVVALVSDAGTPLISDPGYRLVREAREAGIEVIAVPGPCAAITALSIAGLPTDRFVFAGFLSAKAKARRDMLAELAPIRASLVFYESGPRLAASLADMAAVLGPREAAVARELTKLHEECVTGSLAELAARYADAPPKGEIVVVVGPPVEAEPVAPDSVIDELKAMLGVMPPARAARDLARRHRLDRAELYARALELKRE